MKGRNPQNPLLLSWGWNAPGVVAIRPGPVIPVRNVLPEESVEIALICI
jgi:hypothetical protein